MKIAAFQFVSQTSPRVRFKNILFATDLGGASTYAQAYATLLARIFGSHLYVLHVQAEPAGASDAEIRELEAFFEASGVPYTVLLERGQVPDVLNRVAREQAIDLIVLGSHGRHGVSHLFMGSTAEDVARSSTAPVITVGPHVQAGLDAPLKNIIFATDFSEESKLALPYATSLAQEFHANLMILHVAPKHERLVGDREHVEGYLINQLRSLVPHSRFPWCTVSHVVTFGETPQEILDAAKARKAGLIVLGLHSAVRFTSHLPERLSYRILCEAPCPVMSILPGSRELKLARVPAEFLSLARYVN
jgi:nucleotide-binding universal stress UspA family protein